LENRVLWALISFKRLYPKIGKRAMKRGHLQKWGSLQWLIRMLIYFKDGLKMCYLYLF
jgi:hypothetical protein